MTNAPLKRKVLHVITSLDDGGAEGVLTRLCIHSTSVDHVVVSLMDAGKYGAALESAGIAVHCLGMNAGTFSLIKFFKLLHIIRREKPDVVQTWMYHSDLLGGVAAKIVGVRKIFWGIRSSLEQRKTSKSTILTARICAFISPWLPEKIICCANKALNVHKDLGYSSRKLLVIPNGYDLGRFKPAVDAGENVRTELSIATDEFVIGKVGRFDPLKDHANLLQALVFVSRASISFKCLLVGKDLSPDNDALVAQIESLGLKNNIVLVGQRTDIPAVMNALDLHVLSSCSEAFPNVIAEAMACGTPCVSTDVGDALEIIGDEHACCPASDPQALADLIIKMVHEYQQKPGAWQARKAASVHRIAENFAIQAMVDGYEDCWLATPPGDN